jgi:hypothetical protein
MRLNLTGQKFGRWLVLERVENVNGYHHWMCRCDCGTEKIVDGYSLTKGHSTSCGCFKKENTSKIFTTHGKSNGRASEYNIWNLMIQRCTNEKNNRYPRYGGRGIMVCDRWSGEHGFENFYADIGPRPSLKHSIDRYPNNDGNYEPENCRWATHLEQCRNFSKNRWIEHEGIKMILQDWANKWSVTAGAIIGHFKRGKTFDQIYTHYENKI